MRIPAIATLAVLLSSTPAFADKKPSRRAIAAAKKHMDKAAKASQAGQFEEAIKELEAAYALDPKPMLLLARGHAHVKLDQCEKAIELFEQFLATKPDEGIAQTTQGSIDACKESIAAKNPPPPPEPPKQLEAKNIDADEEIPDDISKGGRRPPPRTEPDPIAPARVDNPTPSTPRWYKDPILLGLGVVGVGGMVGGVVLYSGARGKIDDAERAPTHGDALDLDDQARSQRTYAIVAGAVGVAAAGGAVFYYLRKYRGGTESPTTTMTVTPTRSGGIVGWTGRF